MKRDVKVEVVPITDLQPDPNNANTGTERGLMMLDDSLQALGAGRSVLADKRGVLMAGNKTHQRAVELGFQEAVIVHTDGRQLVVVQRDDLDLETDPRARRMAIIDNRVGEIDLQWSPEMLAAIAAEQQEAVAGLWTPEEMVALMAATPGEVPEAPEAQLDRAAELQAQWGTSRGQIWEIPSKSVPGRCHRLMCGDSTSAEDVARLMGGERAALCFTSPPYDQQREYGCNIQDWQKLMVGVFGNLPLTDGAQVLVNLGLVHDKGEWQPYWEPWIEWMRSQGWRRFGFYVWDQGSGLQGDWNGRLGPSHEFVFHFNRASRRPNKIMPTQPSSAIRAAAKRKGAKEGKPQWALRGANGEIKTINSLDTYGQAFKIPDSVIRITREQARGVHTEGHPAVFPDELPAFALDAYTDPGESCYEPFAGSASTTVAAEQTGRVCYGCDIEPKYTAVALQRMADMGLEPRLLES